MQGAIVRGIVPEREDKVADIGRAHEVGQAGRAAGRASSASCWAASWRTRSARARATSIVLIAPQGQVTPAGIMPRLKQFNVVGIFEVGMYEFDSGLALIHMEDAQKLYRMDDGVRRAAEAGRPVRGAARWRAS